MPPPYTKAQFYSIAGFEAHLAQEERRLLADRQDMEGRLALAAICRHPQDALYSVEADGARLYHSGRSAPWPVVVKKTFDLCFPYQGQGTDELQAFVNSLNAMRQAPGNQVLVVNRWGAAAFGLFLVSGDETRICAALTQDGLEPAQVFYAFLRASFGGQTGKLDALWHHWPETATGPADVRVLPATTHLGTFLNVPVLFAEGDVFGNADAPTFGHNAWGLYTLQPPAQTS